MSVPDSSRLSPLAAFAARQGWLKWAILLTASLGAVLEVIDVSIVNVALTDMKGNLGATLAEIGWVVTGYSVANVIIIPLTAWLGERFGRKTYFLFSLLTFIAASMMCGMAVNLAMLVTARILQGLGGGVLLANAQSVIFETFAPSERSIAQAVFGLGVIVGPAIGPTLGGYLTDSLGWRWIFFINLPVGIISVTLAMIFLPADEPKKRHIPPVDWVGIAFLAGGLGCLQTLLEEGQKEGWFESRYITTLALISGLALLTFVWQELRIEHPAVDLRVLRHRSVAAGSMYSMVLGAGLYGVIFAVPIFAQNYLHFTATQTGNLLGPGAIASAIMMVVLAKVTRVVDPRIVVACGGFCTALVAFDLSRITPDTGASDLFWPLIGRGASAVMMFLPLSLATLGPVPKKDIASSSGFYSLTRQLGGSLGIAIITALVARREAIHQAVLAEKVTPFSRAATERMAELTAAFQMQTGDPHAAHQQALTAMQGIISAQAGVLTFAEVFRYVGFAFIATLPLLFLLGRSGSSDAAANAH
jgi:DHA2 family multidrug resistance protein